MWGRRFLLLLLLLLLPLFGTPSAAELP